MDRKDFDRLLLIEKTKMVEQILVIHPQLQEILNKIDYCREHAKYALESIGMLIMGEKGSGKTTIKNIYLENNPIKRTKTVTVVPALSIRIPIPATVGGLNTSLIAALSDPFPRGGTIPQRTQRVYELVDKCKVEICFFDEFQHFAERESFKLNRTVSDWTKNFMGDTGLPLILLGTPKSVEILDGVENEQLRRRFPFRITLKPFGWTTQEDQKTFRKFLEKVDEKLPLPMHSNLADPEMAARIHYATKGIMFEIMRLIRGAAVFALKRNLPKVDIHLLKESFDEYLATNSPKLKNPFKD